jgi:hypothetical protein
MVASSTGACWLGLPRKSCGSAHARSALQVPARGLPTMAFGGRGVSRWWGAALASVAFGAVSPRRLLPAGCGHKAARSGLPSPALKGGPYGPPSRQFEVLAEAHRRAAHHWRTATVATSELDLWYLVGTSDAPLSSMRIERAWGLALGLHRDEVWEVAGGPAARDQPAIGRSPSCGGCDPRGTCDTDGRVELGERRGELGTAAPSAESTWWQLAIARRARAALTLGVQGLVRPGRDDQP